jgi:hypothetical protein
VRRASDPIVGNALDVRGAYFGASRMVAVISVLASDNSPSDKLVIDGGAGRICMKLGIVGRKWPEMASPYQSLREEPNALRMIVCREPHVG